MPAVAKLSVNAPCPCGSGTKLKRCCGVFHRGRAASPAALMRARYSAYAIGDVGFVIDTTHPEGPLAREDRRAWKTELLAYCRATEFVGLQVHAHEVDEVQGRATVRFTASLRQQGQDVGFSECSLFVRDGARWKYFSGEMLDEQ